ncbi:hypothetical protein [Stenotrophomonas sp. TWI377]|uniref:hypothetical protein n=1 Tax=Stenotrophomonas sp. TWI377 TaxID=3136775 RepID=UPI00320B0A7B
MSNAETGGRWATNMSPVFGIAAGTFVAWFIAYCLGTLEGAGHLQQAIRMFGVITSIVLWALFTSQVQDKEIYGGGLVSLDHTCPRTMRRIGHVRLVILMAWVAAIITLCTDRLAIYWCASVLVLLMVVGEVGWRDPWCGVRAMLRSKE